MGEELEKLLFEYRDKFGDGFPTFQLFRGLNEEERIAMVKKCLSLGKDAYDLELVSDDLDIEY